MYIFPEDLRKTYESMPIALVFDQYIDGKVVPLLVSDGFCELVGSDRAGTMAWFTEGQYERVHPDDVGRVVRVSVEFANHRGEYDLVFRARHGDGWHVIHAVGKWQIMPDGTELALLTYSDLTANFDAMSGTSEDYHLFREDQFYTDPLTGLPNLNYLNQFADERVHALRVQGKTPVLIYADVVAMHYFNTQYGYREGNELLRRIAQTLGRSFPDALIIRGQDDHFVLIDAFESQRMTEEELAAANAAIREESEVNAAGIRAGICVFEEKKTTVEVMDHARNALKSLGSDMTRVCYFYSREDEERSRHRRYIIENLDRAMEQGWLRVYYQPIVRAVNGKVCDEEALSRWIDPVRGLLSPAEFIPALEEAGLIYKLDLYVLDQVLEKIRRQTEAGLTVVPHSINLSRSDFDACDIVEEFRRRVDAAGIDRGRITVEITESTVGSDFAFIREQVERFRDLGFAVWMDDFGSGYSSLDVLQSIRFNLIKFDMSFMQRLNEGNDGRVILAKLMEMASALGVDTVCEGVETEDQAVFLQEIGCSKLQGFRYCRAIPFEEILERSRQGFRVGYENPDESEYYETVGRVNLYDIGVIAADDGGVFQNSFSTLPMGVIEVKGDSCRFMRSNQSYRDFIRRFFGLDLSTLGPGYARYDAAFMYNVVRTCCEQGLRSFYDEKMPDGSVVHSFARRIGINPHSGTVAVAVAVLSITAADEGMTYESIARALASDYYNIYYIDLETEEFIEYSSLVGEQGMAMERHGEHFFDAVKTDAATRIYEEDRAAFLAVFSKESILRELDAQGVFTTTYRLMDTGRPVYVNMKITRMPDGGHIIMGISIVDAQMKQKELLERLQRERDALARVMALSEDYLSLYSVDPETGRYIEYSATSEYESLGISKEGEDFFRQAIENGRKTVFPEDLPLLEKQLTRENVLREIRENGIFRLQYRLVIGGEPRPVGLRIAAVRENGGEKLVAGVRAWKTRKES